MRNEVSLEGTLHFAPSEMVRLKTDPVAAELLLELPAVEQYGSNLITVRCYGADAERALTLEPGAIVAVSGQLVGSPAHVRATALDTR